MVFSDNIIITLNSKDATQLNGSFLSNTVFNFKGLLKDEENVIRSYIHVLNAQFPVSFYTVDYTDNIFAYKLTAGTLKTITIPTGNYNANTLITQLTALFTANSDTITTTFNSTTGKLNFTSASSYTFYPYGTNGSTASDILGIGPTALVGTSINCPYPLNLLNKKKLFINSANLYNIAYTSLNLGSTTCIATIPVNQPPYNLINYVSISTEDKLIIHNSLLNAIDIQIQDENEQFINFNNINWSITLCLTIERADTKRHYVNNFNDFLKIDEGSQISEAKMEQTQDEKDLELLQN